MFGIHIHEFRDFLNKNLLKKSAQYVIKIFVFARLWAQPFNGLFFVALIFPKKICSEHVKPAHSRVFYYVAAHPNTI